MSRPITKRDLLWGYLASFLNIGTSIILLPLLLHFLPPDDVGLWFVFNTLVSFAQLLEFGFQPTLARNVAYIYAGAQELSMVGTPKIFRDNLNINRPLLDILIISAKNIYRWISIFAAIVLLLAGTYYVSTLLSSSQNRLIVFLSWAAFASGYIVNAYYGYIGGLLQGRGDVTQANKIIFITRGTYVFVGCISLIAGYSLLGVGIASLLSAIVGRFFAHRYFYSSYKKLNKHILDKCVYSQKEIVKILWHNASRLGAVQVGAFLIQRGNILIASSFLGLTVAASYGMTVSVLMILVNVASVISQMQTPHISALQAKNSKKTLVSIYGEILILSWTIFFLGAFVLNVFGDDLFFAIGSTTRLLSGKVLLLLSIIYFLEMNHSLAATYITTNNHIPFVGASLISGFCIILFSLLGADIFGVIGLVLSQGTVQLAYNNWKWPLLVMRDLNTTWKDLLLNGFRAISHRLMINHHG